MLVLYFTQSRNWEIVDAIKIVGLSYGIGSFGYIAAAIVGEFFLIRRNIIRIRRFIHSEMKGWPTLDGNLILIFNYNFP